jgi:hypothetical protein
MDVGDLHRNFYKFQYTKVSQLFNYGFFTLYKVGSRSIMSLILLCLCWFPPGEPGVPYVQLEHTLAGAPIMPGQVSQQVTQVAAGNTTQ